MKKKGFSLDLHSRLIEALGFVAEQYLGLALVWGGPSALDRRNEFMAPRKVLFLVGLQEERVVGTFGGAITAFR